MPPKPPRNLATLRDYSPPSVSLLLPKTACCSIQLADRDGDGSLVFPEFAMAMAMVARQ